MALNWRRGAKAEFAVIGLGRFGSSVALTLRERGHTVLGIDRDPVIVQRIADELTQAATLDSTDEDALRQVDISSFDTVIVAIGTDFEANLLTTVALKAIGVPVVICKATSDRQRVILLRVGADRVILPEHEAGQRLAYELTREGMFSPLSLGPHHSISEVNAPTALLGMTIQEADVRQRYGVTVLAIEREHDTLISPPSDFRLAPGDRLVILGSNENIALIAAEK